MLYSHDSWGLERFETTLVGSGEEHAELMDRIGELRLEDCGRLIAPLDQGRVRELIARAAATA